eukprot:Gb_06644 [translate_table: standard]
MKRKRVQGMVTACKIIGEKVDLSSANSAAEEPGCNPGDNINSSLPRKAVSEADMAERDDMINGGLNGRESAGKQVFTAGHVEKSSAGNKKRRHRVLKLADDDEDEEDLVGVYPQDGKNVASGVVSEKKNIVRDCATEVSNSREEVKVKCDAGIVFNSVAAEQVRWPLSSEGKENGKPPTQISGQNLIPSINKESAKQDSDNDSPQFESVMSKRRRLNDDDTEKRRGINFVRMRHGGEGKTSRQSPAFGAVKSDRMITGHVIDSSKRDAVLSRNADGNSSEIDTQSRFETKKPGESKTDRQFSVFRAEKSDQRMLTSPVSESSTRDVVLRHNTTVNSAEVNTWKIYEKRKSGQRVVSSVPDVNRTKSTPEKNNSDIAVRLVKKSLDGSNLDRIESEKNSAMAVRLARKSSDGNTLDKIESGAKGKKKVILESHKRGRLPPLLKETRIAKSLPPLPKETKTTKSLSKSSSLLPKETKTAKRNAMSEQRKSLRERLRDGLLAAGWTIDLRPRRGKNYDDNVYISPSGASFWSLPKAWNALKQSLGSKSGKDEDFSDSLQASSEKSAADSSEPLDRASGKLQLNASSLGGNHISGANSLVNMVYTEDLSLLKRKRRSKIDQKDKNGNKARKRNKNEKTSKKGGRNGLNLPNLKSKEEKKNGSLSALDASVPKGKVLEKKTSDGKLLQGPKLADRHHHSTKSSLREMERKQCLDKAANAKSSIVVKSNAMHGKKNKNRAGGCGLLVRGKGDKHYPGDERASSAGKRTVLSWLIDVGVLPENECVQYWNKQGTSVMMEGWVTREGILCECCDRVLSISKFEVHSGSKLRKPFENIYLQSGKSLTQCQMEAWDAQDESHKVGERVIEVDENDQNDDTCGLCGDGGDLICCDKCPSTFHLDCLELKSLPEGNWYCMDCTCGICGTVGHHGEKGSNKTTAVVFCEQCEHEYHKNCLHGRGIQGGSSIQMNASFCGRACAKVSAGLRRLLGISNPLDGGFSWTLLRRFDDDQQTSSQGLALMAECNAKLAVALAVMDECFVPMVDARTNIDMISHVVYNCGSNFNRLNYRGFYTVVLERDDEFISVASIRIHGSRVAEMPLVGTRHQYRRQGMCRRLVNAIEKMLLSLQVEKLMLPAIPDLLQTWTVAFGFKPLKESHKREIRNMNLMVFPGTDLLQKQIYKRKLSKTEQTVGKHRHQLRGLQGERERTISQPVSDGKNIESRAKSGSKQRTKSDILLPSSAKGEVLGNCTTLQDVGGTKILQESAAELACTHDSMETVP